LGGGGRYPAVFLPLAGAVGVGGRIFSTSLCGRGITCTDTSSPTRRAAAAPASVAAFTAPTSPRTITVTYPAPIYSLPIRRTLAAFTMASAASTAPMRPLVSISPNASCDMARTLTDLRQMRQLNYHQRPLFFSPAVRSVARRLLL